VFADHVKVTLPGFKGLNFLFCNRFETEAVGLCVHAFGVDHLHLLGRDKLLAFKNTNDHLLCDQESVVTVSVRLINAWGIYH
jgi:hypothetical protein